MVNAVSMAGNLADTLKGNTGVVLASTPNGTETSTFATFNSLANIVASCVAEPENCAKLFRAATPRGGEPPNTVLQAVANIVKHPAYPGYPDAASDPLFQLSQATPVYQPALSRRPTNWLLFLKFTGGFYSAQDSSNLMSGPGNFAIDRQGSPWISDNYVPQPPDHFACAGRELIRLLPSGKNFPRLALYRRRAQRLRIWHHIRSGRIWVSNFGFQDPPCEALPQAATNNSVSLFLPNGKAISPPEGYTKGGISWPQGTVSDHAGNIWVANCGNDSITRMRNGDPLNAVNIPLKLPASSTGSSDRPQIKPFGVALDRAGNVWVTDNRSNAVSVLAPDGTLIDTLPGAVNGKTLLSHPLGNAADSRGNIWVANSDWLNVPCPTRTDLGSATNPSITVVMA